LSIPFNTVSLFEGQYGIPRPWYFPFQKSYWFETTKRNTVDVYAPGDQQGVNLSSRDAAMTYRSGGSRVRDSIQYSCANGI